VDYCKHNMLNLPSWCVHQNHLHWKSRHGCPTSQADSVTPCRFHSCLITSFVCLTIIKFEYCKHSPIQLPSLCFFCCLLCWKSRHGCPTHQQALKAQHWPTVFVFCFHHCFEINNCQTSNTLQHSYELGSWGRQYRTSWLGSSVLARFVHIINIHKYVLRHTSVWL
jgi:hypothetical protein